VSGASLDAMTTARDTANRGERGAVAAALGIVAFALLVGIAGGYAAGHLTEAEPGLTSTAPLEAASPSVPFTPYSADVLYPSWEPDLDYRRQVIGTQGFQWSYLVPKGWESVHSSSNEYKWGVPGHPLGSYGFRIELVLGDHETVASKVTSKLAALRAAAGVTDIRVLSSTSADTLAITYRALPQNWLHYNTFRWFAQPGSETAAVEISVNGRTADQPGMIDLLDTVSGSLQPL
jgi:hypothetical protein